jgi:hypothetical protein
VRCVVCLRGARISVVRPLTANMAQLRRAIRIALLIQVKDAVLRR